MEHRNQSKNMKKFMAKLNEKLLNHKIHEHRRISRHSLGGAETNVALMTGNCLSVFALISIMKILFSHENLPFFALISCQPEC